MHTTASIRGHPVHAMLVPLAIGGFLFSFAFDLIRLGTGSTTPWLVLAYYTMLGGILGGIAAALPGFIDMLSLPAGPVKRTALVHMGLNLTVVAAFVWNLALRHGNPQDMTLPTVLSLIGIAMLAVSGWLGGKMVFEAGVGVANENRRV